mmetsp:Transcript_75345/g.140508  ORF Transcript_75345/g.140508 Transcript_75345/m.140508 type:complete len:222 (-) Transcript_75345:100-765(-)
MTTSTGEDARPVLEARIRELEEEVAEQRAQQLRLRELLQDSLRREAKAHQCLEQSQRSSERQVTHTFDDESDSEEAVDGDDMASRELESAYESLGSGARPTALPAQSLKAARAGTELYTPRTVNFWDEKVRNLEMLAQQIQQSQVSTAPSSESTGSESGSAMDIAASGDEEANESTPSSTPQSRSRCQPFVSPVRPKAQDLLAVHGGVFSGCRLVGQSGLL